MKIYEFNTKQGNRNRRCKYGLVHDGKVLIMHEAQAAEHLAIFQKIDFRKNGKWSSATYRVTVKEGTSLIICMSPFDGWPEDMEMCLEHVKKSCSDYLGDIPTDAEAMLFFQAAYPTTAVAIAAKEEAVRTLG